MYVSFVGYLQTYRLDASLVLFIYRQLNEPPTFWRVLKILFAHKYISSENNIAV